MLSIERLLGNKKQYFGVSITPEVGIELAQIDYASHTVLKYACKPFEFDVKNPNNVDLDIFKDTLYDLLTEMEVPPGSEISLTVPASLFKIKDWPASMEEEQLSQNVEDYINDSPQFKEVEGIPSYDFKILPNSTIQSNKILFASSYFNVISEIALQIRDINYELVSIDVSVNATLNTLLYSNKLSIPYSASWVVLVIENGFVRIIQMSGRNYVYCYEESINISPVFDDAENCSIILDTIADILKKMPSSLLYVISKTNIISAKMLSSKITYATQIAYLEANIYGTETLIDASADILPDTIKSVSMDVIGAAIYKYNDKSACKLNLFNKSLGDIWLSQTPPSFHGFEFSVENSLKLAVVLFLAIIVLSLIGMVTFMNNIKQITQEIEDKQQQTAQIESYLAKYKDISTSKFSPSNQVKLGVASNGNIYRYYEIVGNEIPQKLWLTKLLLGEYTEIDGQADNVESIYSFYRSIKDYLPDTKIKMQKLMLASGAKTNKALTAISDDKDLDVSKLLTSMNADCYEFRISDREGEAVNKDASENTKDKNADTSKNGKNKKKVPVKDLENIE